MIKSIKNTYKDYRRKMGVIKAALSTALAIITLPITAPLMVWIIIRRLDEQIKHD